MVKKKLSKGSFFGKRESLVDGTGFEPSASTKSTQLHLSSDCLETFADFMLVNRRLEKYLRERDADSEGLFVVSDRQWKKIWKMASESAGVSLTSKVLRAWFITEMGELGVADRFIDIFQGRAPRSVLAKHYTGRRLDRLKRIYNNVNLKIL